MEGSRWDRRGRSGSLWCFFRVGVNLDDFDGRGLFAVFERQGIAELVKSGKWIWLGLSGGSRS
jgi:hypothetical protein